MASCSCLSSTTVDIEIFHRNLYTATVSFGCSCSLLSISLMILSSYCSLTSSTTVRSQRTPLAYHSPSKMYPQYATSPKFMRRLSVMWNAALIFSVIRCCVDVPRYFLLPFLMIYDPGIKPCSMRVSQKLSPRGSGVCSGYPSIFSVPDISLTKPLLVSRKFLMNSG